MTLHGVQSNTSKGELERDTRSAQRKGTPFKPFFAKAGEKDPEKKRATEGGPRWDEQKRLVTGEQTCCYSLPAKSEPRERFLGK